MSKKVVSVNDKVPFLNGKLIEARGGVSYVDVTLTQDNATCAELSSVLQLATGWNNIFAHLISELPTRGPTIEYMVDVLSDMDDKRFQYVYRRNNVNAVGAVGFGNIASKVGQTYRVWEIT